MTPEELKARIDGDEIAKAMAADGDYAGAATQVSALLPPITRPVPNRDVKRHAILNGYWSRVVLVAENKEMPDSIRGLAIAVGAWINDADAATDFALVEVRGMLSGLTDAGLMTAEQRDSLLLLANHPQAVTPTEVRTAWEGQ